MGYNIIWYIGRMMHMFLQFLLLFRYDLILVNFVRVISQWSDPKKYG